MAHSATDLVVMENTELIQVSDEKYKYINTSYEKVSAKMFDYNCNIKLKIGKETFRAHKDVLAAASDYFEAMFNVDMCEKDKGVIEMHDLSSKGFSCMLEYFYHGHVTVDSENIEGMIEAARFFHIEWMLQICCHFLVCHLSLRDFDHVIDLTDKFYLGDLRLDIFRYVGMNFMTLTEKPIFMETSYELLYQLLAEDFFIDAQEKVVFDSVMKWLDYAEDERKQYKVPLLELVRFPLVDKDHLEKVPEELLQIKEIKDAITAAKEYHVTPSKQCLLTSEHTEVRGAMEMLILVSAVDDAEMIQYKIPNMADFFQEEINTKFLESTFEFASTAVLGNFLFVAGGYNRKNYCSSPACYRYDPRNRSWAQLASMQQPRVSFPLCSDNTGLYAVAGIEHIIEGWRDDEHILNTVEYYDPNDGQWSFLPTLPLGCFGVAATVSNNKIYVSGGISDNTEATIPVNYLHTYKRGDEAWTRKAPMIVDRHDHSMTAVGTKLYVFGGYTARDDDTMTSNHSFSSEIYDIETDQWTQIKDFSKTFTHLYSSVAYINNKIYIIGGREADRYLIPFDVEKEEIGEEEFCGQCVVKLAATKIALPFEL